MNMFSMLCLETTNVLSNIIMYEMDVSANIIFESKLTSFYFDAWLLSTIFCFA
jgi:hypothetical protein